MLGGFEGCPLMSSTSFRCSSSLVLDLSQFISLIITLQRMLNMYLESIMEGAYLYLDPHIVNVSYKA